MWLCSTYRILRGFPACRGCVGGRSVDGHGHRNPEGANLHQTKQPQTRRTASWDRSTVLIGGMTRSAQPDDRSRAANPALSRSGWAKAETPVRRYCATATSTAYSPKYYGTACPSAAHHTFIRRYLTH